MSRKGSSRIVLLVPLPRLDRALRPLPRARLRQASRRVLRRFGEWFGSATLLPSWGSWKPERGASVTLDPGQQVVLVLTEPSRLTRRSGELRRLLQRLGSSLDQEQMIAIRFRGAGRSFLVRCPRSPRRKRR